MRIVYFLIAGFILTFGLMADSFKADRIPEKAKWYVNFDMENAKNTEIGKNVITKLLKDENFLKINEVWRLVGVDPINNLKNISLYGMNFNKNNWVLIYEGSVYVAKLLDYIKENGNYDVTSNNGIDIYSASYLERKFYFFLYNSVLYVSKDSALLDNHIQMIIGKEKSLKDVMGGPVDSNNSVFVFSTNGQLPENKKDAMANAVFKIVTKLEGVAREEAGLIKGSLLMEASDSEATESLQQLVQGAIGLAKLKFAKKPILLDALKAISVSKENNKIIVKGEISSDNLFEVIKEKCQKSNETK